MGTLFYGDARFEIELDDRALAHLRIVILTKLRRNESFAFSWVNPQNAGSGRGTIWVHPALALHFKFLGNTEPLINRSWLSDLSNAANRTLGLVITPEPTERPLEPEQADERGTESRSAQ
jgi:hypothetical protein